MEKEKIIPESFKVYYDLLKHLNRIELNNDVINLIKKDKNIDMLVIYDRVKMLYEMADKWESVMFLIEEHGLNQDVITTCNPGEGLVNEL